VRIWAPARKGGGPALGLTLGVHRLTLSGEAFARHDGVTGLCVNRGVARVAPGAPPTPAPPAPATPAPGGTASPPTKPLPDSAKTGQCLWLSASGNTHSAYAAAAAARDRQVTASTYRYRVPAAAVTVSLDKELAGLSAALHSGAGGGSDVEGGGQSMCLETGAEGSAADLGSTAVEVTKPPPPTRLRLILILERRHP
jgi:hypothetical protein